MNNREMTAEESEEATSLLPMDIIQGKSYPGSGKIVRPSGPVGKISDSLTDDQGGTIEMSTYLK